MRYETYHLRELFPNLPGDYDAILTAYCPDNSPEIDRDRKRTSVLLCPGGGYEFTSDREAEPVALRLLSLGYNAFILRYGVNTAKYPEALLEAAASVAFIRSRADEFHADTDRIAVCGFSAGAHLAASLSVFWKEPFIAQTLAVSADKIRPDAQILCYPVLVTGKYEHEGSFAALLGDKKAELSDKMSLDKRVDQDVPPAFLWHTLADKTVPVENSLIFAQALRENGVPFELHIYPEGGHGLSLCNFESGQSDELQNPHCASWLPLCDEWLHIVFRN